MFWKRESGAPIARPETSTQNAEPAKAAVEGFFDTAWPTEAGGWVWCPGSPSERPEVELRVGDRVVATVLANQDRPDVRAAGRGDGFYGFRYAFPHGSELSEGTGISAVVAGVELQNSPRVVNREMIFRGGRSGLTAPPRIDFDGLPYDRAALGSTDFGYRFDFISAVVNSWAREIGGLAGKRVLELGCGDGAAAVGVVLRGAPGELVGIDITPRFDRCAAFAKKHLGVDALPESLRFHSVKPGEVGVQGPFDFVFSWSVLEHVHQRIFDSTLRQIRARMRPGGHFMFQVSPLYYSAEGGHFMGFGLEPWGHLLRQHDDLHAFVRANPERTEAEKTSAWECYTTLNRITADELVEGITRAGFELLFEYRSRDPLAPPERLTKVYNRDALTMQQILCMFRAP